MLGLTRGCSAVAGHKVNMQKAVVFLFTIQETENEIKIIAFIAEPKGIKYLVINSTKGACLLDFQNDKSLL